MNKVNAACALIIICHGKLEYLCRNGIHNSVKTTLCRKELFRLFSEFFFFFFFFVFTNIIFKFSFP